jgi:hypothetical protein
MKIAIGRYPELPADEYHQIAALGASGAFDILDRCPAYYWHNSAFNPDFVPKHKRDFDFGTACHIAVLEPATYANRVVVIDADSYRTNAAKEARDAAYAVGKTPILAHQLPEIEALRDAVAAHPIAKDAFFGGHAEITYVWKDPDFGLPCKLRADYVPESLDYIVDLKSTTNAHPAAVGRTAVQLGWPQRAAWYLDGIEAAEGRRPKDYWFVCVEKDPPHLISVCRLDERAIEWGSRMNRKAVETLAWCIDNDAAPGYRHHDHRGVDMPFTIELPGWAEFRLADRDERGEFKRDHQRPSGAKPRLSAADVKRSIDFLKPVR